MDEKLKQIVELREKGLTYQAIAQKMGMTRGGVSGKISMGKKKGIIPAVDYRSGKAVKEKRKYKKTAAPKEITQMPVESISESEGFVVIVGKGMTALNNILSQVRL